MLFSFLALAMASCRNPVGGSQSEIPFNHRPGDSSSLLASVLEVTAGQSQTAVVASALTTPLRVRAINALGRPVSDERVVFTVTGGNGSLTQSTADTDVDGYAQASWTLGTVAGNQTVSASIQNGRVVQTFSAAALPGAATALEFQTQPAVSDAQAILATSPVVRARDSYGNLATSFNQTITMTIQNNPASGVLGGTVAVAAVSGVVTFSTLTIDRGAVGYTLAATAGALSVASSAFNVRCAAILDSVSNPAAAYSLRKLRTAYAGSAIRVRRSFDNTLLDVGFDAANCGLDTSAISIFAATTPASNLFVHTWYDQTTNLRNSVQATNASQPLIATAGVLERESSRVIIRFNGSTFFASSALGIAGSGGFAYNAVLRPVTFNSGASNDGSGTYFLDRVTETAALISLKVGGGKYMLQKRNDGNSNLAGYSSTTDVAAAIQRIHLERQRGVQFRLYVNNTLESTTADSDSNITPPLPNVGRHAVNTTSSNFGMMELLIFGNFTSTADRNAIDASQLLAY